MVRHVSGPPHWLGRLALLLPLPCAGHIRVWRGWPCALARTGLLLLSPGLYAGIKFFLIDFIFKRCPRLRAKYDTPYIIWRSLPTDPQLKERSSAAAVSRRVGWPQAGAAAPRPARAPPSARGSWCLSDFVGPLKHTVRRGFPRFWHCCLGGPSSPGRRWPLGKAVQCLQAGLEAPSRLKAPQTLPRTCPSHAGAQAKGRQGAGCWP